MATQRGIYQTYWKHSYKCGTCNGLNTLLADKFHNNPNKAHGICRSVWIPYEEGSMEITLPSWDSDLFYAPVWTACEWNRICNRLFKKQSVSNQLTPAHLLSSSPLNSPETQPIHRLSTDAAISASKHVKQAQSYRHKTNIIPFNISRQHHRDWIEQKTKSTRPDDGSARRRGANHDPLNASMNRI